MISLLQARRTNRSFAYSGAAITAGVVLSLSATALRAQSMPTSGSGTPESTRRASGGTLARSSLFGALSGSIMAMGFYFLSEKGDRSNGCQPLNCALPFLTTSGAIAGLFIGRELDAQRRAFAPRAGESIRFAFAEVVTLASPTFIDARDSLIAVVSDSGAQMLSASSAPRALRRRAVGLNAMRQVAIVPSRGSLMLGTGTALWEASLLSGPASRVENGAVDALASSHDAVMSASGRRVRWRSGVGSALRTDSLDMAQSVSSIAFDSTANAWWVATDSALVQVTENSGKLSANPRVLPTPVGARAIALNREWIAAALGDDGIIAWSRDAVSAAGGVLSPLRITNEPRFAYDLAFLNGQLFVAGGVDGLFQMSLTPTARVVGSSRQVQFATTVRAANGVLWVGDRTRKSVVRVTP